jgi:VWFA-related protein
MTRIRVRFGFLLGMLLVPGAFPQKSTFHAESNVVTVPTLVKDEKGQAVYGLQAGDFIIEDDGVQQAARMDESADSEPISMVLLLQCGRRANREFPRMLGLKSMINPVLDQPGSEVALVEFDSGVNLVRDFTSSSDSMDSALNELRSGDGGAAILDAVQYSLRLLAHTPKGHRRVLLLISETRDHGSHFAKIDAVVSVVGTQSTVVYALPFSPALSQVLDTERGSNQDEWGSTPDLLAPLVMASQAMRRNTPKTIAEMTGGEYQVFTSRKSFERLMTSFTNHLQSRYLLSFEPKNPHPGLHQIRVRLREPSGHTVLARTSYWANGSAQ